MKKIIALVLSVVMICCFSVTAFAAESPSATEKVTVTIRKAAANNPVDKVDVEYTLDKGAIITVKADEKYGKFDSWSVYKSEKTATGTSTKASNTGIITLSAVINLTTPKTVEAVQGTDYEIVGGSLTATEMTIKVINPVIVCGNYDNVKTNPNENSNVDKGPSAPQTGDMTAVYVAVVMLAAVAFGFGVKKVYSK